MAKNIFLYLPYERFSEMLVPISQILTPKIISVLKFSNSSIISKIVRDILRNSKGSKLRFKKNTENNFLYMPFGRLLAIFIKKLQEIPFQIIYHPKLLNL